MENWDILIGVLLVIVFVLLVQRVASPFRCESGEEEKNGGCVSNSTKERWWAFWEEPKCKRGELQSDYTCLASMIWDAVSPAVATQATASAPATASTPALTPEQQNFQTAFAALARVIETDFLVTGGDPIEFTMNIGISDGCPLKSGTKIRSAVSSVASIDDTKLVNLRQALQTFFTSFNQDQSFKNDIIQITRALDAAAISKLINDSIKFQDKKILFAQCTFDIPINPSELTSIVPMIIAINIAYAVLNKYDADKKKRPDGKECMKGVVITLGADGQPNGQLTGPGQTITRGAADTYAPGKVRLYGPIAIDGVGKANDTSFRVQVNETSCDGQVVEIGDWAKFDVKKI